MDKEIIFLVEEAPEGGYVAKALGHSIYTEGETIDDIREEIKDAVRCHFDEGQTPKGCSFTLRQRRSCGYMRIPRDLDGKSMVTLLSKFVIKQPGKLAATFV